jgi:ABC-2 type transport system ATP-binding protein
MAVQAVNLGKSYGKVRAVDNLTFTVDPGVVTGFLGPNGSGKSTTMRLMLELDRGSGRTLWDGVDLKDVSEPARVVGAHLDVKSFHPSRTARNHLRMLAAASGVSNKRVDEVIDLMGLASVAKKRPKGFSMGMGQRLGLASAILAEPRVLLLDEPANGLDPQSIQWMRDFLRFYAGQGNTVFVSSHLLNEMQVMADNVVVIAKGRLVAEEPMAEFVARSTRNDVLVRSPDVDLLVTALTEQGLTAVRESDETISVVGVDTVQVGDLAFSQGARIWELTRRTASLEQAFLEMTGDAQEYALGGAAAGAAAAGSPLGEPLPSPTPFPGPVTMAIPAATSEGPIAAPLTQQPPVPTPVPESAIAPPPPTAPRPRRPSEAGPADVGSGSAKTLFGDTSVFPAVAESTTETTVVNPPVGPPPVGFPAPIQPAGDNPPYPQEFGQPTTPQVPLPPPPPVASPPPPPNPPTPRTPPPPPAPRTSEEGDR